MDTAREQILIAALKDRHDELVALLAKHSSHWYFEDPIYRFYHQSFKVFALQDSTEEIVRCLRSLLPDTPLHRWFGDIVAQGTGRTFSMEDNRHWPEVTRPIVEAFFHARFFLEMATRYGNLEAPPRALPSGYAALLYLYQLR
jgi:hypothetical protein